jgi:glycosyltransferase involved in cell wall biosynthesis
VDPRPVSGDVTAYRRWIEQARGELTVAKDVYVRPRSGWFSDRSVCFLAAGRPVVTQDTGFGARIPTGRGLLAFATVAEAAEAVRAVEADWAAHARAARALAVEHFDARRVVGAMLAAAGVA